MKRPTRTADPVGTAEPGRPSCSYGGVFLVTMSTLMYEILLTRIFSVTMWYHFAFLAISVAMFGLTAGALAVYLLPDRFRPELTKRHMALSTFLFGLSIPCCYVVHAMIPFVPPADLVTLGSLTLNYLVVSVPFVLSGISVTLALTRHPESVGGIYAADLGGAAAGCIGLLLLLNVTDGPSGVLVVAGVAMLGSLLFALAVPHERQLRAASSLLTLLLLAAAVLHSWTAREGDSLLRPIWVKGVRETTPMVERWNSYSRITVRGDSTVARRPVGWGLPRHCAEAYTIRTLYLDIDAGAGTILTKFDGDLSKLDFLRCDIVNVAHHLRPQSSVLVIGTGGGRDLLAALVFQQESISGIEVNRDIIETVHVDLGDFTGHLERHPRVRLINDEARSFVARDTARYDIIQISLIDSWAATAAGAFVLTENSLYTVEAFRTFFSRLAPGGILSVSRWHFPDQPSELLRLASLAFTSLRSLGVSEPDRHIAILFLPTRLTTDGQTPVGTLIASIDPLSGRDLEILSEQTLRMGFQALLLPGRPPGGPYSALVQEERHDSLVAAYPLDVSAPTDERPFFFHMLRLSDFLSRPEAASDYEFNLVAIQVLVSLLIIVTVLTGLCIFVPLVLSTDRRDLRGSMPEFLFFGGIGLGFMLIEISQVQRLIVFLGHPTYGLSVLLFSLLLASGVGSLAVQRGLLGQRDRRWIVMAFGLLTFFAAFGMLTPTVIQVMRGSPTSMRIGVGVILMLPLGFFMGMPFPVGIRASSGSARLWPWYWGINGAVSVLASVLAVAISLARGISFVFWLGALSYAVALVALKKMKGGALV